MNSDCPTCHLHEADILHTIDLTPLRSSIQAIVQCIEECKTHTPTPLPSGANLAPDVEPALAPGKIRLRHPHLAKEGLPICIHCHKWFSSWDRFYHHVEYICKIPPGQVPMAPALDQRHERLVDILTTGVDHIADHDDLREHLMKHCAICDRFCSTSHAMQCHWSHDHYPEYLAHGRYMTDLIAASTWDDPCIHCKQPKGTNAHNCIVIRQFAMLAAEVQLPLESTVTDPPEDQMYRCSHCPKVFVTKHGLRNHVNKHHRNTPNSLLTPDMRALLGRAVGDNDCAMLPQHT